MIYEESKISVSRDIRMNKDQVMDLLNHFDTSSDNPLHNSLDFDSYSAKLSENAYFIIAYSGEACVGFVAYYLNDDGRFVYVPQVVVHKNGRHQGVGHLMFSALFAKYASKYDTVRLEVLKENHNAREFYIREGFSVLEDHNERLLLERRII